MPIKATEDMRDTQELMDNLSQSRSNDFLDLREIYTVAPTQETQHSDDIAVDQFAQALKDKMRKSREKGRSGWDDKQQCQDGTLQRMLVEHIEKGDPLDVGAFAMMLFIRGERTNNPLLLKTPILQACQVEVGNSSALGIYYESTEAAYM